MVQRMNASQLQLESSDICSSNEEMTTKTTSGLQMWQMAITVKKTYIMLPKNVHS